MTKTSWFPVPVGLGVRGNWIRLGLGEGTEVYQPEKDTAPHVQRPRGRRELVWSGED